MRTDYLPQAPTEPPETRVVRHCAQCLGEVYEGEEIYRTGGELVHRDCWAEYSIAALGAVRGVAGEEDE